MPSKFLESFLSIIYGLNAPNCAMPLRYAEIVISYGKYHTFANYMTIHGRIRRQNFGYRFLLLLSSNPKYLLGASRRIHPHFGDFYQISAKNTNMVVFI